MGKTKRYVSMLMILVLSIGVLIGFGAESAAAETPAPTAVPVKELVEEQPAEPVAEEVTPAMRAAAKGLPEPPDVDITSWEFLIANSYNSILFYAPPYAGFEGQGIDARIFDATSQLIADIRAEGYPAYMASIVRNYEFWTTHFINLASQIGGYEASKVMAGVGCNEHQTGLCFDITADYLMSANYNIFDNYAVLETDTYQWMLDNCTDYGFILRYPEGKEEYYGTPCTAGHFRYVGVEAAKYITENNLCLEEFVLLYDEDAILVPGIN